MDSRTLPRDFSSMNFGVCIFARNKNAKISSEFARLDYKPTVCQNAISAIVSEIIALDLSAAHAI